MTRPTACTISTFDLRELKKSTASRLGTSIPSDKHRTFVKIRHSTALFSHESFCWRTSVLIVPSTCSASTPRPFSVAAIFFDALIFGQNATTLVIGTGSNFCQHLRHVVPSFFQRVDTPDQLCHVPER